MRKRRLDMYSAELKHFYGKSVAQLVSKRAPRQVTCGTGGSAIELAMGHEARYSDNDGNNIRANIPTYHASRRSIATVP